MSKLSRRNLVIGSAAPIALLAVANVAEADPIFVAIEKYEATCAAFIALTPTLKRLGPPNANFLRSRALMGQFVPPYLPDALHHV
jgi:hypothetical protein